jgi:hypothetical protein
LVAESRTSRAARADLARETLAMTIRRCQIPMAGRHVLQAVAFLGSGVGWVDQRHPALCPQLLDLVKMFSDPGGFFG